MTISVGQDDSREKIAQRAGRSADRHAIRNSDARRRRLQRNARRQARTWGLTVKIDEDHETAHIEANPDEDPTVVVTGRKVEQEATDYEPMTWDWIGQQSFEIHEVGHDRYSDIEDKDARIKALNRSNRGVAHSLWNAAEDGAIEKQITRRWSHFYAKLRALRANLFTNQSPGIADPEHGGYVYPVAHAAQAVTLDLWMQEVYNLDAGITKSLVDPSDDEHHFATEDDRRLFVEEVMFQVRSLVKVALNNSDAVTRNEKMFAVIEVILDLLDDADSDGKAQKQGEKGQGDDGAGMPDDSRDNHSGAAEADAEELEGEDDAQPSADGEADESGQERPTDIENVETNDDLAEDARDEVLEDARQEAGITDDLLDEIDEMQDAMKSASDETLRSREFHIPDDRQKAPEVVEKGRKAADRLAQILRNRLQAQRRTETVRNQPRGSLDERAFHRTATGSRDIKKRSVEPEEPDYSAAIVLDRSGSMSGPDVFSGASAMLMWLMALEDVGVDTMGVDLFDSSIHLSKPMGVGVEESLDRVASTATAGGTPLSEVLAVVRERLIQQDGEHFMVVVTDGAPRSVDAFENELRKTHFPVVGVTIGDSDTGQGIYHRSVNVDDADGVEGALEHLLHEVML
jgi:cobaltochelatase CobT